eukprot:scaffold467539_cov83-Attheya_sp.AAC.2
MNFNKHALCAVMYADIDEQDMRDAEEVFGFNRMERAPKYYHKRLNWKEHIEIMRHQTKGFAYFHHMTEDAFNQLVEILRKDITCDYIKSRNSTGGNDPIYPLSWSAWWECASWEANLSSLLLALEGWMSDRQTGCCTNFESVVPGSIPGVITYHYDFFKSRGRRVTDISFEAVVWNVLLVNGRFIFFVLPSSAEDEFAQGKWSVRSDSFGLMN